MIISSFRWRVPVPLAVDPACRVLAAERGISERLLSLLARRGVKSAAELAAFLAPPEEGWYDPSLLPDSAPALARVALAQTSGERVLVYGDFDADGLTGLSILVIALRAIGIDAAPYVPERLGDGHGLSLRAIDRAADECRTLIVTADCGTSSGAEIEVARGRGIDVLVTDHHHAATWPAAAVAVVNPQRADSEYPERHLTGAGVAWKVAHLLLRELGDGSGDSTAAGVAAMPQAVRDLADLAVIGTVADVAPLLGENRVIARIGMERLRSGARPGLAALVERAGLASDCLNTEDIGFGIAPRLNAAGRMGEAARAGRLLLATDRDVADELAAELEKANLDRREMTKVALAEVRQKLGLDATELAGVAPGAVGATLELPDALLVQGEWGVGIVGLIAGRLAEDFGLPAVVATVLDAAAGTLRASCRSGGGINMAEALIECDDLLIRHGGHAAAAGFDIAADRWPDFEKRFVALASAGAPRPKGPPELALDLVLPADAVDFGLVRELKLLEPTGPGNLAPVVAVRGLRVVRVRSARGGATQLVLGRARDVLDGVAFRRPDLAEMLHEGDRIDVVARPSARQFGGFESVQLEVIDVSAEGAQLGPYSGPAPSASGVPAGTVAETGTG
jgi:single-stranded-DNA-specific exonuclease